MKYDWEKLQVLLEKQCATGQKKPFHTMISLAKHPTGKWQVRLSDRHTSACHPVWCRKKDAGLKNGGLEWKPSELLAETKGPRRGHHEGQEMRTWLISKYYLKKGI